MRVPSVLTSFASLLMIIVVAISAFQPVYAFSSKEKTPQEEAAEVEKKVLKEYNDGVKHMEKARSIAQAGDSIFAYNYRATSDAKARKEFEKAVGNFKQAIKLKPDMAEAHNNLGYSYRKLGRLEESLKAYQKAIGSKPDFAQAHEYLGETYLAMDSLVLAQNEHDLLVGLKSPYADTLAHAIEVYQLEQVAAKQKATNGK